MTTLTVLTHHGINFVPFGYSHAFPEMESFEMIRGGGYLLPCLFFSHELTGEVSIGSAWGAGTYAGPDGKREPNKLELTIAEKQGHAFWNTVSKVNF